jgi:hypothetical protein
VYKSVSFGTTLSGSGTFSTVTSKLGSGATLEPSGALNGKLDTELAIFSKKLLDTPLNLIMKLDDKETPELKTNGLILI